VKNSHIIRLRALGSAIHQLTDLFYEDKVTVYAAQASFFVIISAVPFLSLLAAVFNSITPTDLTTLTQSMQDLVPAAVLNSFTELLTEIRDIPSLSLVSISALTTLWSASKGISAIRNGLQTVYHAPGKRSFFHNRFYSLCYTLCFIVMLFAITIILLFGDFLYKLLSEKLLLASELVGILLRFKTPIFTILISLVFNTMYYVIGRRNPQVPVKFFFHLPGAMLAAVGWNVFSLLYSFYITHAPKAFSLYGGLTAICLIMLWLYFCMIILLSGAEFNKILYLRKSKSNRI